MPVPMSVPAVDSLPEEVQGPLSIIPYVSQGSEKKAAYLAFRYAGFATRESFRLAGIRQRTVQLWRKTDPRFADLEAASYGPRRVELRRELQQIAFSRNLHLYLERDYTILLKARDSYEEMTKDEKEYLLKVRSMYTAQQQAVLDGMLSPSDQGNTFNLNQFIFQMNQARAGPNQIVEHEYAQR
jgi:hypothetical protein